VSRGALFIHFMPANLDPRGDNWDLRLASALRRYGGAPSILVRACSNTYDEGKYYVACTSEYCFPVICINVSPLWGIVNAVSGRITPFSSPFKIRRVLSRLLEHQLGNEYHSRSTILILHEPRHLDSLFLGSMLLGSLRRRETVVLAQHHSRPNYWYRLGESGSLGKLFNSLLDYLNRRLARSLDYIYVLNKYDEWYYRRICHVNARMQTMGVDTEHVTPLNTRELEEVRERYNLGERVMVHYGVLEHGSAKGTDVLIRLYKRMGGEKSGWKLVILGRVSDFNLLVEARRLGVIVPGWLRDHKTVLGIMGSGSVFVFPARMRHYWNGPGVASFEAAAMNIPLITPFLNIIPPSDRGRLGVSIPWSDRVGFDYLVRWFVEALNTVESERFRPRLVVSKYFDWRVIVGNILRDVSSMLG